MNVSRRDIMWTYLAKFFSLGVNVILLPLMMSYLTDTELALWYIFASISQVVNLFDFGFNPTISRHMTYAWSGAASLQKIDVGSVIGKTRNEGLVTQVYHTCKVVYFAISICAAAIMLSLGSIYLYEVLDHQWTQKIVIAWLIYTFSVFLNLFYGYWSALLQGIGAIAERNKMTVYAKTIQMLVAFALLILGYGLLGFVISYTLSGITLRFLGRHFFLVNAEGLDLKKKVSMAQIKACFSAIWFTAWRDGIVMLAQYLTTQANTLICAYFIDLEATSSYGVITQIFSMISTIACALYSSYQPSLGSAFLQKDIRKEREIVCKTSMVYSLIFIVLSILFIVVGIPILHWIRPSLELDLRLILLMAVFFYLYQQHCLFCSMIAAGNRLPYCQSYLITAIFTVIVSICATKYGRSGIWGLVGAQLITNIVYNNWKWPLYMMRQLNLNFREFTVLGIKYLKAGKV